MKKVTKPMEEEVSEELLEQVNKELEFAVMNSNFLLAHTEAFAVLIDGREDGEPVEMFLNQNQLLHVYARIHAEPEIYKEIEIPRSSNLDESEIAEQTTLLERIVVQ